MAGSQVTYRVVEVFGPTIQGEGPQAGQLCNFIRLGGCDWRCSWCDSLHAVLPEEVRKYPALTVEQVVVERLQQLTPRVPWVVISGGNPLLNDLEPLINELHKHDYKVAIETQGSVWKDAALLADVVVVSPKPPSSGMHEKPNQLALFAEKLSLNWALKVVVFNDEDLRWAARVHADFPDVPFYVSCGTMPDMDSYHSLLARTKWLVDATAKTIPDACVLPQLHVVLWGHVKGV